MVIGCMKTKLVYVHFIIIYEIFRISIQENLETKYLVLG